MSQLQGDFFSAFLEKSLQRYWRRELNLRFRKSSVVLVLVVEHWKRSFPFSGSLRVHGSLPNHCFVHLEKVFNCVPQGNPNGYNFCFTDDVVLLETSGRELWNLVHDCKRDPEIDMQISARSAVMQTLDQSLVVKKKPSLIQALDLPFYSCSHPHLWSYALWSEGTEGEMCVLVTCDFCGSAHFSAPFKKTARLFVWCS